MQAVILAGGKGTRLRPLTYQIPKPMAPVAGKPFLEHLILYLKQFKINVIIICAGSLWDKITNYFNDGKKWQISIKYSIEKDKLLGTGGALKQAEDLLDNEFIILNGDTFLPINYYEIIDYFQAANCQAMITVYDNSKETLAPGNIALDNKLIIEYNRKEKLEHLKYIDAGVGFYQKSILNLIPSNRIVSLEEEIFPLLISKKQLIGYPINTKFYDIGTADKLNIFEKYLNN